MSLQYVLLIKGVDLIRAEHVRRWFLRFGETVYTTDEHLARDCASLATSLICVPDGDVDTMVQGLKAGASVLASFLERGGNLVVMCGGYHALTYTRFFEIIGKENMFQQKKRVNVHNTEERVRVVTSDPFYVPLSSEVSVFGCCDGCCNDYSSKQNTVRYAFEKESFVLSVFSETRGPAITSQYCGKGMMIVMSVIPLKHTSSEFDFVCNSFLRDSIVASTARRVVGRVMLGAVSKL
ncbi:hypothetical protein YASMINEVIRUS_1100 [Yasminevirus sp. GU-2018]|uniref:Uncharacterized protein n=1 Tax=Yasminevirus sp. GU-2018 TaxID=2420051 RepID=A0A5K0UAW0_9VIRU|nr:hypothetical protein YASMINEVIRUS_1100 [Yasminevirus sp. GU-2018]